ncbi:uncharacterized protein [Argopecten irradians]|uniref:uncharacterized protein n=1 Tax=Argopecten irradians TaxID=31199 RepID=UPI00371B7589
MGKKYCCIPGCSNTSDTIQNGSKVIMRRFPMSEKKTHIRRLWISRVNNVRSDFSLNDNTRICSAHFDGPFDETSIPTIFPSKPKTPAKPRRPLIRHTTEENWTDNIENISDQELTRPSLSIETQTDPITVRDYGINTSPKPVMVDRGIQVGSPFSSVSQNIQTDLPRMTVEDIRNDDNKVKFYTGFIKFEVFWLFFQTLLKHGADRLNYWEGEKRSMGNKPYQEQSGVDKPGRKRFLRPIDEFLMVCMRLRLGLLQEHLADIFRVSETTVSRIMNTWINFIYDHSLSLVAWPSREQILSNLPRLFLNHPQTRVVVDCTEFFTEKPSSLTAQWLTWSEYKHSNTFKVLIGVAPNGMVTFVSRLWGGNVSDRHITQHDGFLPKLSAGDIVMADKGFTVEDLLPVDVGLNVPPRVSSKHQMSSAEFFKTNNIASARIVVEMKMEQLKNYNIVNSTLPLSEAHLAEQMVLICAAWTNLLPPLLQ